MSIDSDRNGNNSYNSPDVQEGARTRDDAFGNNAKNSNGTGDYSEAPPIPREPPTTEEQGKLYGDKQKENEATRFGDATARDEQRLNDQSAVDQDEAEMNGRVGPDERTGGP